MDVKQIYCPYCRTDDHNTLVWRFGPDQFVCFACKHIVTSAGLERHIKWLVEQLSMLTVIEKQLVMASAILKNAEEVQNA